MNAPKFEPEVERLLDLALRVVDGRQLMQQHEYELRIFLGKVRDELKPKRIVEIGSYKAWNAALLSHFASEGAVTMDATNYGPEEGLSHGKNLRMLWVNGGTRDAVDKTLSILGGKPDLVFIDDGHEYSAVKAQSEIWTSEVNPGGWIAYHDINPAQYRQPDGRYPADMQVVTFWKELIGNKEEIIATQQHASFRGPLPHGGIGILRT